MIWECEMCGNRSLHQKSPIGCKNCGTVGVAFYPMARGLEDDLTAENLSEAWVQASEHWDSVRADFSFATACPQ